MWPFLWLFTNVSMLHVHVWCIYQKYQKSPEILATAGVFVSSLSEIIVVNVASLRSSIQDDSDCGFNQRTWSSGQLKQPWNVQLSLTRIAWVDKLYHWVARAPFPETRHVLRALEHEKVGQFLIFQPQAMPLTSCRATHREVEIFSFIKPSLSRISLYSLCNPGDGVFVCRKEMILFCASISSAGQIIKAYKELECLVDWLMVVLGGLWHFMVFVLRFQTWWFYSAEARPMLLSLKQCELLSELRFILWVWVRKTIGSSL